jgi:hypothetical protein
MTTGRYQLIEPLTYPRSSQPGALVDRDGARLHGTYERSVPGGYRAALVNNGKVVHRYQYPATLVGHTLGPRHTFSNLVHTLRPWLVPADAKRPITNFPSNVGLADTWCPLWHEPIILSSVIADRKPAGLLSGSTPDTDRLAAEAIAAGLLALPAGRWTNGLGQPHVLTLVTRPGFLATDRELQRLREEYRRQLPWYPVGSALGRVRRLSGEELVAHDLVNPRTADDLVVSGFCFGYPPATTAACIDGTHG